MADSIPGRLLLQPEVLESPYAFYRRLRDEAPVWRVPGTKIFVVSSFSLLEEATRRVEDFSSNMRGVLYRKRDGMPARLSGHRGMPQVLATADPPSHNLHRKAVFPELVAKRMAEMAPDVQGVADECLRPLLSNGGGDFMALVGNPLPMTVVSKLVGFRKSDINKLLQAAFDSTDIVSGALSLFGLFKRIFRSLMIQFWISGQLRGAPTEGSNILAAVKRNVANGTLRKIEGRAILHILLAAGGESTSSLLGNAVRILAENQSLQGQLRADPSLIPAYIEEVLRVESPFRFHLRSTAKDTSLGGVSIPADSTVLLFWASGNRDPLAFDRADEIDLGRPRKHLTFGRGIHTCVGAPLARLETLIVLQSLLKRTRQISLDPADQPQWVESLQVRRHERLPIKIVSN